MTLSLSHWSTHAILESKLQIHFVNKCKQTNTALNLPCESYIVPATFCFFLYRSRIASGSKCLLTINSHKLNNTNNSNTPSFFISQNNNKRTRTKNRSGPNLLAGEEKRKKTLLFFFLGRLLCVCDLFHSFSQQQWHERCHQLVNNSKHQNSAIASSVVGPNGMIPMMKSCQSKNAEADAS